MPSSARSKAATEPAAVSGGQPAAGRPHVRQKTPSTSPSQSSSCCRPRPSCGNAAFRSCAGQPGQRGEGGRPWGSRSEPGSWSEPAGRPAPTATDRSLPPRLPTAAAAAACQASERACVRRAPGRCPAAPAASCRPPGGSARPGWSAMHGCDAKAGEGWSRRGGPGQRTARPQQQQGGAGTSPKPPICEGKQASRQAHGTDLVVDGQAQDGSHLRRIGWGRARGSSSA